MILKASNLIKSYGGKSVVNDVSLNLKQGEIVGLLGPNGAGKTTSFYMIVGLIKPNSGSIYLDDKEITSFPMYCITRLDRCESRKITVESTEVSA